jgi:putative ABC transport system permease protein
MVIYYPRALNSDVFARVNKGADVKELVSSIEKQWMKIIPEVPFDFVFLNSHIDNLYQSDMEFSNLINYLTILIIIIASLGLYGIMALVSQQKEQEMSIRKVFGASTLDTIHSFARPFLILILIANILAWPLILLLGREWLSAFEYQTTINWIYYVLPTLLTIGIVLITLFLQIEKVVRVNPTETLRYE